MKIIEFWAPWCGPCKISKAAIKSLAAKGFEIPIEEINADENEALVMDYGIKSLPTMILLDDYGVEVARQAGAMTAAQIEQFAHINTLKF